MASKSIIRRKIASGAADSRLTDWLDITAENASSHLSAFLTEHYQMKVQTQRSPAQSETLETLLDAETDEATIFHFLNGDGADLILTFDSDALFAVSTWAIERALPGADSKEKTINAIDRRLARSFAVHIMKCFFEGEDGLLGGDGAMVEFKAVTDEVESLALCNSGARAYAVNYLITSSEEAPLGRLSVIAPETLLTRPPENDARTPEQRRAEWAGSLLEMVKSCDIAMRAILAVQTVEMSLLTGLAAGDVISLKDASIEAVTLESAPPNPPLTIALGGMGEHKGNRAVKISGHLCSGS